jgi:hypothetical protein
LKAPGTRTPGFSGDGGPGAQAQLFDSLFGAWLLAIIFVVWIAVVDHSHHPHQNAVWPVSICDRLQ